MKVTLFKLPAFEISLAPTAAVSNPLTLGAFPPLKYQCVPLNSFLSYLMLLPVGLYFELLTNSVL